MAWPPASAAAPVSCWVPTFHMRTRPSVPAAATSVPSALKAAGPAGLAPGRAAPIRCPVAVDHSCRAVPLTASVLPSGLRASRSRPGERRSPGRRSPGRRPAGQDVLYPDPGPEASSRADREDIAAGAEDSRPVSVQLHRAGGERSRGLVEAVRIPQADGPVAAARGQQARAEGERADRGGARCGQRGTGLLLVATDHRPVAPPLPRRPAWCRPR